ncbi:hypothetical protein C475_12527 [Halosimplex carlsbadense 2-9-1]|uniref:Uncharacterized protein n=1 Tax=Halosimplex carlsbadense 2-9-1 TaxID=797114 RepID=M0CMD7_9EURY|nr:hypothetical protein [Halosimplex carlsbadense]ELZ24416.1 hypothetical protein C475_12527 [Halosimplex carlsbadense 2-9-1]
MVELENADGDAAGAGTDDRTHEESADGDARADAHLDDVADGCGCTEIWEHLSEERADD